MPLPLARHRDIVDRQYDLRAGRLLAVVVGAEEVFDGVAVRVGLLHRAVRILGMDGVASQHAVPMTGGD